MLLVDDLLVGRTPRFLTAGLASAGSRTRVL